MSWLWHAAHIQHKTQSEVVEGIRTTLETVTQHKVAMVNDVLAANLLEPVQEEFFVSPQQSGWTTFWGGNSRICSVVMEAQHWSGLLVDGEDELGPNALNYWQLMFWQEGRITDWFVSEPEYLFSIWSSAALKKYALPYLQIKGVATEGMNRQYSVQEIVFSYASLFSIELNAVRRLAKPAVNDAILREWLGQRPIDALANITTMLDIPFSGSDYCLIPMAVYHNIANGKQKLNLKSPDREEIGWTNYYEAGRQLPRIAEIMPVVLRWTGGAKARSRQINNDFAEVFSWQF